MKKKFVDQVYMREVLDKVWYLEEDKDLNGYIALKYVKDISKPLTPFCNGKQQVLLDRGYSLLEYIPKDRNYNCRVFFDTLNRPLLFYFDINNGVGIENGVPWYDDLYLDVIMECHTITETGHYISLSDEGEFKTAFKEGDFDQDTYDKGYRVAIDLMTELRQQKNDIVNRCQFDIFRIKNLLGLQL